VNKFRIFSGKVGESIDTVSIILNAYARPQNFIICDDRPFCMDCILSTVEEEMEALHITPNRDVPLGMSFLPVILDDKFEAFFGISCTVEAIVEHIRDYDIHHPSHNTVHQRREQLEAMTVSPNGSEIERIFVPV
jgi:hypothetical protein